MPGGGNLARSAHLFLGLPLHAIANQVVDLDRIDAALARRVVHRIAAAGSWNARFAAMDALISQEGTIRMG